MRSVAIFLYGLFLCLFAGVVTSDSFAQVRLNEILADPVGDWDGDGTVSSKNDEWVEIVNAGTSTVDLSCFRLGDLSGGYTWRFGFGGTLAPGQVLVVYGSDAVAWQGVNGFPSFGLSLNNGGDTVFLYDVAGPDTVIVDEYAYQSFEVLDDRSTGRFPDGADNWAVFDALNPYGGTTPPLGNGCAPSPGSSNVCGDPLPVERSTWGSIKELYR